VTRAMGTSSTSVGYNSRHDCYWERRNSGRVRLGRDGHDRHQPL